jgi:hypothetical protein
VLGIIGAVTALIPFLFWLGGTFGLLGLILGLVGRGRAKRGEATNKGAATAGAALSALAMVVAAVVGVVTVVAVGKAVKDIDQQVAKATSSPSAQRDTGTTADTATGDTATGDTAADDDGLEAPTGEPLEAGDSIIYDDDLTITVSAAKPYTPDEYAVGHTKGNKAYEITVQIENGSKAKFDTVQIGVTALAGEDGVQAEEIYDDTHGSAFSGTVLPGRKATAKYAFDAPADAKNLIVEVSPDITYEATQWELTP